jgi:hypothetical protein
MTSLRESLIKKHIQMLTFIIFLNIIIVIFSFHTSNIFTILVLLCPIFQFLLPSLFYKPMGKDELLGLHVWLSLNIYLPRFTFNKLVVSQSLNVKYGSSYIQEQLKFRLGFSNYVRHYLFRLMVSPIIVITTLVLAVLFIMSKIIQLTDWVFYTNDNEKRFDSSNFLPLELVTNIIQILEIAALTLEDNFIDKQLTSSAKDNLRKMIYESILIIPNTSFKRYFLHKRLQGIQ